MLQVFMSDERLRAALAEAKTIAIVGAKDKPGQAVDDVGRYLIAAGYRVIPVHPVRKNVWGLKTYASLAEVQEQVDIVDVFRAPEFCPGHALEAANMPLTPKLFWMQLGIRSAEASQIVGKAGMAVVDDKCIMVEHRRLLGGSRT